MAERRIPAPHAQGAARPVTVRPGPSDDDVRELVRRVVDALGGPDGALDGAPGGGLAPVASSERSGAAADRTAAAATSGPAGRPREKEIALGADHGGVRLKGLIAATLAEGGYSVHDCGTTGPDPVDYPDFAHAVARLVADGTCAAGIAIDGAGIGSCMTANKVPGVRAALCYDVSSARNSREHNHANVLTLGARLIGEGLALEIVSTWLGTPWGGGRHAARVEKITEVERRYLRDRSESEAR